MGTGIAHEMNQPLAIIRAQADVIKLMATYGFDDPSQLERDINEIITQTERATTIIEKMRGFARGSNDEILEVDVTEPAERASQFFREIFKNYEIELKTEYRSDLPKVYLDPPRFEQIVVNLLSNAQYAVNKRSKEDSLSVSKEIKMRTYLDRGTKAVVLEVEDNGNGMNAEQKTRCLEPFYTGKKVGEGTGLGLSIVHSIVQDFDGLIRIDSEIDHGTSVKIHIPVK